MRLGELTKVILPSTVTDIQYMAFAGHKLESISIPNSVTSIGSMAFYNNPNLNSITIKRASSEGMTLMPDWHGTCPEENIYYQP